jgi:p-cumate 2,3-dioxygenase beta subunit
MLLAVERSEIENFLFMEADLLDEWHLNEWASLFSEDGTYLVHGTNLPIDTPSTAALFFIADDYVRIRERAKRLYKRTAIAEFPHSRTRHFISNVRAIEPSGDEISFVCNLLVHRWRDHEDTFVGVVRYRLVRIAGDLKIREKRCILDRDNLQNHSHISIIL